MARSIILTEQKVTSTFDRFNEERPARKMTYQEEIDELIRKTSPEYKNYHIPVKGYRRDPPAQKVAYELDDQNTPEPVAVHVKVEEVPLQNMPVEHTVYSNVLDDHRALNEVLKEASTPEPVVEKEEFIITVKEEEDVQRPVAEEPLFKEIKEDKSRPHEIKNPIEKVDIMHFFKFG
jgi:hypothetical protein